MTPPQALGSGMRRGDGFTLVELMVSMAIGLSIVLAMLVLLVDVNRHNTELGKSSRMVENGRYALQLLQEDVAHAGYWGGYEPHFDDLTLTGAPDDVPASLPDPCLSFSAPWTTAYKVAMVGIPVQTYEIPSTVPSPTLSVCASQVASPKANTDVLFVRRTATCAAGVGTCPAMAAGEVYFQVARCGTGTINPPYAMETNATLLTLQNRDCATVADKRKLVSNLYYVRSYAATSGDGIPTLVRSQFGVDSSGTLGFKTADPMIEGVEGFRVELGIDNVSRSGAAVDYTTGVNWADSKNPVLPTNRGDGVPDGAYVRCTTAAPCTAAQLMNTVAAKIYVLVRSEKTTPGYTDTKTYTLGSTTLGPFNDGYKRQLFTQSVRVQNVSSRRETQG